MLRSKSFWLIVFSLPLLAGVGLAGAYWGFVASYPKNEQLAVARSESLEANARGVLATYCAGCHSAGRSGADFDERISFNEMRRDRSTWETALTKLRSGAMPPRRFPQPTDEDRRDLIDWIETGLLQDVKDSTGPVMVRRLLRSEYTNALHDLLGMTLEPGAADLWADDRGWDRYGSVPKLAEPIQKRYRAAAVALLDEALAQELASIDPPECDPASAVTPASGRSAHLFLDDAKGKPKAEHAREVLASFARRAYRRPIESHEIDQLMAIFESVVKDGASHENGMHAALLEVLTSPHFLCCIETRAALPAHQGLALAARLSFFLWSSIPDDELLREADRLLTPGGLQAQVGRLLKSPRSQALATDFARHWLSLATLDEDRSEPLARAARQETEHFFANILREDRSVLEFLDSDYTFLNEALATHYGIQGVYGEQMRRVTLAAGAQRGGLLTQASFLKLVGGSGNTNPVMRGKWVLENLLAAAPFHPPLSVVEALQNTPKKFTPGTARHQMEEHRANPSCAECHARMDAIGLALENFGPTGALRSESNGFPIDQVGSTLPDGTTLNGPADLKAYLLKHRNQFVRALSERLLAYALGRKLTDHDRAALQHIPERVAAHGFRFSQVVFEVAQSEPFLTGWSGSAGTSPAR